MVDEQGSRPPELLAAPTGPDPNGASHGPTGETGAVSPAGAVPEAGAVGEPEDRPLDPEKLLRLAGLVRAVLDEVRQIDPDQATAAELSALHRRVTVQVEDALPNALREELQAIDLAPGGTAAADPGDQGPTGTTVATGATGREVRFAYAGLIGWLSGLFQGLQAAMQFQQMQAMNALPGGAGGLGGPGGQGGPGGPDGRDGRSMDLEPGTGHYL